MRARKEAGRGCRSNFQALATRYAGCPKKTLGSDKKKETVNYNNGNDNDNNNNGIGNMLMERHHTKSKNSSRYGLIVEICPVSTIGIYLKSPRNQ